MLTRLRIYRSKAAKHVAVQLLHDDAPGVRRGLLAQVHVQEDPLEPIKGSEPARRWALSEAIEVYMGLHKLIQEAAMLCVERSIPLPQNYNEQEFGKFEPPEMGRSKSVTADDYSPNYLAPPSEEMVEFSIPPQLNPEVPE